MRELASGRQSHAGPIAPSEFALKPQHLLILLAYTAAIFLFNLGGGRGLTHHELYVAEGAREMLHLRDWIVPRILNEPWLEKPPLAHWMISASFLIGGVTETAARMPSAICGTIGVVLLARLAAAWYGSSFGLLVGLIQATTVYTLTYARLAEADIYLWAIVMGCIYLFGVEQIGPAPRKPRRWRRVLFWALVGLTQYAKGPLFGAVMALVPCLLFAGLTRDRARLRWFFCPPGWIVCAIAAVAWPTAVLLKYPETAQLWYTHTFARIAGDHVINPEPWWLYFYTTPWQVLPWTLFGCAAIVPTVKTAWREPASIDRFLWLWLAGLFVVLSVPSAKHHHYLIYALPPFSFWAARMLLPVARWTGLIFGGTRRFAICTAVTAVLTCAGVIVARQRFPNIATDIAWMAPTLWLAFAVVIYLCVREMWDWAAGALFAGIAAIVLLVHQITMPRLDRRHPDIDMLQRLQTQLTAQDQVVSLSGDMRRQWFYLNRDIKFGAGAVALSRTPGVYLIYELNAPIVIPAAVKLERIDRGATLAVDRVIR